MSEVAPLLFAVAAALAVGVGSALLPLINAEAYAAVVAISAGPAAGAAVVVALAAGQTAGKLVLFEAARRGTGRRRTAPGSRWGTRVAELMRSRRGGSLVVLAAATVGVPPLALVSVAAGVSGQRLPVFALLCLVGRAARFGAIVAPLTVL